MPGWDTLEALVREEIIQREQEGCDVSEMRKQLVAAGGEEGHLFQLYQALTVLQPRPGFPYVEPNSLEEIRAQAPVRPHLAPLDSLNEAEWQDKFLGAWLGRAAGCALGKPLETWDFMYGKDGRPGWQNVRLWFEGAGEWPISGYTPGQSTAREEYGLEVRCPPSQRENIRFMESDDDLRYTVLGLILLEEKGLNFDRWDVGKLWHSYLQYHQVCTAETQAYLNFAQITSHMRGDKPANWNEKMEWVRAYLNPYQEWIGAQIRADGLAYGVAGQPTLAAELAWRDASFSHVKNGVYGEMFMAAVIAAAFTEPDNEKLVEIGLAQIPHNCRLAEDIRRAVDISRKVSGQSELVEQIWQAFQQYNPVHTNNNAALVVASLLFAGDDFEKAITTEVMGGWDTDCNGATLGSIMGAKLGAKKLPGSWIKPLKDTLYAEVRGFDPIAISECARRSYEVWQKLKPVIPD
jgi:ADP-ribosylglycohydrolase